jgi:hypothetical protein
MYVILSERLGEPGAKFDPTDKRYAGANIDALIAGGFIGEVSPTKAKKSDKTEVPDTETLTTED